MGDEPERRTTFLVVGRVGVTSLGRDRFVVTASDEQHAVEGFEPARQLARALAEQHV